MRSMVEGRARFAPMPRLGAVPEQGFTQRPQRKGEAQRVG